MKNNFFILLFFFVLSCSKQKKQIQSESKQSDSISIQVSLLKQNDLNYNEKLNILKKSKTRVNSFENSLKKRKNLIEIAFEFYNMKALDEFRTTSHILLKTSEESKDSVSLAMSYRYLGGYFKSNQQYDSSYYYYNRAEKLYTILNKPLDYGNILINKGIIQSNVNDLTGADLSLNLAYSIYKKTDEYNKIYAILNQLGLVYRELKYFDKAIEYHNKALDIVIKQNLKDNNEEANCLGNIGLVYEYKKDYKKANYFYRKSLTDKNIKKENPILYATLIDNLAYSKIKLNDNKDLLELLSESLKIRDSIDDKSFIILSNIHFSEYFDKINDVVNAVKYSNKALQIAKKGKIPLDIIAALKQAAAVDKINASDYTNEYIRINDSLLTAERKNLDRFARIQLETDEVIKENKALGTENQNMVYYLLGTIGVFALMLLIFNEKQKQKIVLLKQQQQATNQQIFDLMINQQDAIAQSRTEEKKRMAKELHDGVLGKLFGTRLFLDGINSNTSIEAIVSRKTAIVELQNIEQQIREISHDMSSEKGKIINNFVGIVMDLIESQKKTHGTKLKFVMDEKIHWEKLDNFAKINLYRILQESLQNINKYAHAKKIGVSFSEDANFIQLKITDDGKGFDVKKGKKGIGIANMKERAEESKGEYKIESTLTVGTTTTVALPTNLEKTKPTSI